MISKNSSFGRRSKAGMRTRMLSLPYLGTKRDMTLVQNAMNVVGMSSEVDVLSLQGD